jgi:hypothetical protein
MFFEVGGKDTFPPTSLRRPHLWIVRRPPARLLGVRPEGAWKLRVDSHLLAMLNCRFSGIQGSAVGTVLCRPWGGN